MAPQSQASGNVGKSGSAGQWTWALICYDSAALLFAGVLALLIRHEFEFSRTPLETMAAYLAIVFGVSMIAFLTTRSHRPLWRYASLANLTSLALQVSLVLSMSLVVAFVVFRLEDIPRSVPLLHALIGIAAISAPRLLYRVIHRSKSTPAEYHSRDTAREHVLVAGIGPVTDLYLRCVEQLGKGRFSVEGILTEYTNANGRTLRDVEILGPPSDLHRILADLRIHGIEISRIAVTAPFEDLSQEAQQTLLHWEQSGEVTLDLFEERLGFRETSLPEDIVPTEQPIDMALTANPVHASLASIKAAWQHKDDAPGFNKGFVRIKRACDMVGAAILIIALLPIYFLGAIIVLVDLGFPIVFWQVRPGLNRVPIRVHKFRTMGPAHDRTGRRIQDCARLSPAGVFLRRTRLDELPQLFDVLIGNMSLIGPRPLLPKDMPHDVAWRDQVRPGITGWAQVNGGHLLSPTQKLSLDRWYIENASLLLDAKILYLTALAIVRGDRINPKALAQAKSAQVKLNKGQTVPEDVSRSARERLRA